MTLDQLKGFCAVAEERSFSKAARRMYLTQPAISMQIKALEQELAETLLDRGGREVLLTDAGRILYEHARSIFESIDAARHEIEELQGLARGHLVLACSDTLSTYALPPVLSRYSKDHPGVEVTILNKTSPEIVRLVLDREVELGLAMLPVTETGVVVEPLIEYRDTAACAPTHPLAAKSTVRLAELARHRLLLLEPGSRSRMLLDQAFEDAGIRPENVMGLGSVDVLKAFAAIGLGVAVIPEYAIQGRRGERRLSTLRIHGLAPRRIGAVIRADRTLPLVAQTFLASLKKSLQPKQPRS